jgi:2-phosphosulfolactate phosphatase
MTFDQAEYTVRCEWGRTGVQTLGPVSDVVIIVDTLSFCTCVEIAVSRGAQVIPCRWKGDEAKSLAHGLHAELADERRSIEHYSLSPQSLLRIAPGTRLVLPSPNGSTLALDSPTLTIAGCLRNSRAVAELAIRSGKTVAVIPAGEQWEDGTLRPAFEDHVAAGSIISHLSGTLSPESETALAAFQSCKPRLQELLLKCSSGKELTERGFAEDVCLASELNCSEAVPILNDGCFVRAG